MSEYVTNQGDATFIRRLMKWNGTEFHDDAEWAEREILWLRAELAAAEAERDELRALLREARVFCPGDYYANDRLRARIDATLKGDGDE